MHTTFIAHVQPQSPHFSVHTNEWRQKKYYWILNEVTCLAYFLISYFPLYFVFSANSKTHFVRIHTFARNFSSIWNQCRASIAYFRCRNISSRAYRSAPFFIVLFFSLSFFLRGFTFVRCAFIIAARTHDVFVIRKSKYLVKDDGEIENMKHDSATAFAAHTRPILSFDYNRILVTRVWMLSQRCRNRLGRIKSILIKWINDICFCESAGGICGLTACTRGRKSNWRRLRRWDERNDVFLFGFLGKLFSRRTPIAE